MALLPPPSSPGASPDIARGAFWLLSMVPTQPLPLQEPRWMCYQCHLAIGTDLEWHLTLSDLVKLSLGHGCPSQRQLFPMDGFRGLSAPCSQFTMFPLKVIINPAITIALHNFLLEGHPFIPGKLSHTACAR